MKPRTTQGVHEKESQILVKLLNMLGENDDVNKVFSNDNAFLKSLRGLSMATVNNSTVLREKLFREANGLLGDLPALMKGQAL